MIRFPEAADDTVNLYGKGLTRAGDQNDQVAGLVRSAGGWLAVNMLRQAGFRQKADERILGDGEFVSAVLKQADRQRERRYDLRAKGYDFEAVVKRVAELLKIASSQLLTNSKSRHAVRARSLVCFWAFNDLGINQIELARRFRISQPAVSSAVRKGEKIVKS